MPLEKRYNPAVVEPHLVERWEAEGTYRFSRDADAPVFSIDTPPLTASGYMHLGHAYSYSHADFIARYKRMNGYNVFYPMGYDDNGLPTERLVERRLGIKAQDVGRSAFIAHCLQTSDELEREYEAVWRRLALSIDWRYTYRTIDRPARRTSQLSFVDLYDKGLAYRRKAPVIWCPECRTAIAQAEENDLHRETEFVTLPFTLASGETIPIATTRPELLAACVAVFVHPEDSRYHRLAGHTAIVPLYGQGVPILEDERADPSKGTGAVMCCTFGDNTDVEWWYVHHLPLIEAIGPDGRMTAVTGSLAGLPVARAREAVKRELQEAGLLLGRQPTEGTIRVHERCDTPVEFIVTPQWFIAVLDESARFIATGTEIAWHPPHMEARYREWIENMHWDWLISRQRYFGVPFPVWYCEACGEIRTAPRDSLPVDPTESAPEEPCACGETRCQPEVDVMDTWATSSMSPQIAGRMLDDPELYSAVFPFTLRPQAHEIIRTWVFDTVVKSRYNFDAVPWSDILISGWGLAAEGAGKISKSRGGGPMAPLEMVQRYSADAVRYWAGSTGPGKDAIISEEKIAAGAKLATKLWNVARLAERWVAGYQPPRTAPDGLTTADRWLLSRLQRTIASASAAFDAYEYGSAKTEVEGFFWTAFTDNYLEMAKGRLYDPESPGHDAVRYTLHTTLLTLLKLFAPFIPFVTDQIYRGLFDEQASIHTTRWPAADTAFVDANAERGGQFLLDIATRVRRYKSDHALSLGAALEALSVVVPTGEDAALLAAGSGDIASVTRAAQVEIATELHPSLEVIAPLDSSSLPLGVRLMQ
jgi:valyl-tRNA synthetase